MQLTSDLLGWLHNNDVMLHFPRISILDIIEMLILAFILYTLVSSLRGTRAWMLMKGLIVLLIVYSIAYALNFTVIVTLFQSAMLFLGVAIVVTIQPELRRLIEQIGTKNINISLKNILQLVFKSKEDSDKPEERISDLVIQEIARGCSLMGKAKTGVLIVIEREIPLNEYIDSGIKVNADITSQLLINVFEHNTPLHDGAVVVRNNKLVAATCYLPLSDNPNIDKDLGTRHRAGIGISECTDALVVIVSEETGAISVAKDGQLYHNLDREGLIEKLKEIQVMVSPLRDKKISKNTIKEYNIPIKTICLASSIILWFIVITTLNPITTTVFNNIPIEYINTEMITDTEMTFEPINVTHVNVKLRDRRDVIDSIRASDIKVIADLSKLSYVNSVPLEYKFNGSSQTEITLSESTLQVQLEPITTIAVDIEVERTGEPNELYYISDITLDSDTLAISGGKSIINTIGRVVVEVDQSKLTSNADIKLTPIIYDKNGKAINLSKLTLNKNEITATVHLYKTKKVPLDITVRIDNQSLSNIIKSTNYAEREVYITGSDELLDQYDSLQIEVLLDLNLEDITQKELIRTLTLQNYVSDDIVIIPQYNKINLNIEFVDFYTKTLIFGENQIEVRGLNEKLKYNILTNGISADIVGKSKNIENLSIDTFKPYIDLTDYKEGTYEVNLKYDSEQYSVYNDIIINIEIQQKDEE